MTDAASYAKFIVTKGCDDLGISKGQIAELFDVKPMGADFSHAAKVFLRIAGRTKVLWVAHHNRLNGEAFNLTSGSHTVRLSR